MLTNQLVGSPPKTRAAAKMSSRHGDGGRGEVGNDRWGQPGEEKQANDLLTRARRAAVHLGMPKLLEEIQAVTTCS